MKICFKFTFAGSGSDIWTHSLAKQLKKHGVDTDVQVYPHHFQYYPFLLPTINKPTNADIIHTNSWSGWGFADPKKTHVTTEHLVVHDRLVMPYKNFPQKSFHKLIFQYEKQAFEKSNAITAVSNYSANKVKEYFNKDAIAIQNGIDVEKFIIKEKIKNLHPQGKNKIKLLFAGNFSRRKGADLLPKIMKELGDNFVLFTTAGLQNKTVAETPNIVSIGKLNQDELIEFYNYCDIFLFPTRLEGLSLTTLEAMSCGMPVITSDCFSMPELIDHQHGGYLCQLDNIEQFTNNILQLADSPSLIDKYGLYNRQKIEKEFSLDLMTQKYIKLYESLLSSSRL
jgi:glycosyltransferase involved in cell wall biosynthesis